MSHDGVWISLGEVARQLEELITRYVVPSTVLCISGETDFFTYLNIGIAMQIKQSLKFIKRGNSYYNKMPNDHTEL